MYDSTDRDKVVQQCGEWLDADGTAPTCMANDLSDQEQMHIADIQFVDAMLSNLSADTKKESERRIQIALEAIDRNERNDRLGDKHSRLQSAFAIAASILVMLGLAWTLVPQESRASVVLREIGQVTRQTIDRVYTFRRHHANNETERELEGKLYLRGREGFVLRCGDLTLGRSGDEYWLVLRDDQVVISDSFQEMAEASPSGGEELEILKQLCADSRKVPIMQLSGVVELLSDGYDLSLDRENNTNQTVDVVLGVRRDETVAGPQTIRLWAASDSRIIHRTELTWGPDNTLTLELAPSEQVPQQWYNYEAHLEGQRDVLRIPHDSA